MKASAARVLTYAELPGFLESIERKISAASAFQWRDLDHGNLSLWLEDGEGAVIQMILREDLADELRAHQGVRCAILDAVADGTARSIAGSESARTVLSLYRASKPAATPIAFE